MPEEKKRLRFWPQSTIMRIFLCVALLWFGIIAAAVYLFVCNTKSMSENGCELPLSTWQDVASVAFDRKKSAHLLEAERSFLEAMTLERASDYTGAHKAFEQAITECTLCYGSKALPTCVFRMEQARFEDKFHHWRQAETLCADALKDFPEDGPLGVRYYLAQFRASILMKQRQYKEAVSAFQEAIKTAEKLKQPDRESVRYSLWWLAYAYTYNRQESEAKATYDRLLKLEREHKGGKPAKIYSSMSWTAMYMHHPDEAIADISEAIKLEAKNCHYYMERARLYQRTKNFPKALVDLDAVARLEPKNKSLYFERGMVLSDMHLDEEAIKDFTTGIELDPKREGNYKWRAWLEEKKGLDKQAIADYSKAIEMNAKNGWSYFRRGVCYEHQKDDKSACFDYGKAIQFSSPYDYASLAASDREEMIPLAVAAYRKRAQLYERAGTPKLAEGDRLKAKQAMDALKDD